jgi:hypothetical protein
LLLASGKVITKAELQAAITSNTWRPVKYGSTTLNDSSTTLEFAAGSNIGLTFSNGQLTIANNYSYSLPLAANGTRGGIQIGYTSTENNRALLLDSEKAYITLPSRLYAGRTDSTAPDAATNSGFYYSSSFPASVGFGSNQGTLFVSSYDKDWVAQIAIGCYTNKMIFRKKGDKWSDWETVATESWVNEQLGSGGSMDLNKYVEKPSSSTTSGLAYFTDDTGKTLGSSKTTISAAGLITVPAKTGIAMTYTSGGDDVWLYPKGADTYGIRYFEGSPDAMAFSATSNNTTKAGADLCINGNGDGTVTMRGKNIATQEWVTTQLGTGGGSGYASLTGNNIFSGKNTFTATNSYNTTDTQKFLVGNGSSAFCIGGDGLQCFSGLSSTTGKIMYINYYGGDVAIGQNGGTQSINLQGTVKENGIALSATYLGINAKAADSSKLDGKTATATLGSDDTTIPTSKAVADYVTTQLDGSGGGSGYVQGSGTANCIPKFTDASTIGDSVISQAASNKTTIGGKLVVNAGADTSQGNCDEGIRILPQNGWSEVFFSNNTDITGSGGWIIARRGSAGTTSGAIGDLTIEYGSWQGTGLTLYANGNRPTWNNKELAYKSDFSSSVYDSKVTITTDKSFKSGAGYFTLNQNSDTDISLALNSSAAGNRAAETVVIAAAEGQINSMKYAITNDGNAVKATWQYNSSTDCVELAWA